MRRSLVLSLALLILAASPAAAEDGWRFRRTTPRAALEEAADRLAFGVPSGRAWGIESALRRLPVRARAVSLVLAVTDPSVREAFVRVAYYARADVRSRQIAVSDSIHITPGDPLRVTVELAPPEDAVAYRVRVLARLVPGTLASAADAIAVTDAALVRPRPSYTRLRAPP